MRLETIKLAGFKSFVDPTVVHLPSNLVSIVGPNGCGKSNIIDAVRWVLGEASAKHLRGESMADVIFNGSTERKPLGQASIELVFDNSDGSLGGEYAKFSEIAIRRTVTRDGLSNYYLNGTRCRRRDITDIFLGTGLGPRSYAIIEQGMISRLIEAKPEDLRVYLEEAAGISKYKERRRDTENRIRRTRENLERLRDFRDELERQLRHLERQAAAAERFSHLKAEERRFAAELLALQWRRLDADAAALHERVREREVRLEAVQARHTRVDADIEQARERHVEATAGLGSVQERYYTVGALITRIEQEIRLHQERAQQLQADLEQTRRAHADAKRHLQEDTQRQETQQSELTQLLPALASAESNEARASEALALVDEAMQQWQSEWDEFSASSEQPRQQAEVQQSRIRHLEESLQQLGTRLRGLEAEQGELATQPLEEERLMHEERARELEELSQQWQERTETVRERIELARSMNTRLGAELDATRGNLQEQRGRLASLRALQQAALGQTDALVTGWLQARGIAANARLAERLRVEAGWETAVETVLGDHLQAVCVDGVEPLAVALSELDAGTIGLFSPRGVSETARPQLLAARVDADFPVTSLLAGVHAADSLADALALRPRLAAAESVVTRDGIWLGCDWLRFARDKDARKGVIQRNREIAALEESLEMTREREAQLLAARDEAHEELRGLEAESLDLQRGLRDATARYTEARSALSACGARLEQLRLRAERNQSEREQYHARHEAQRSELQESRSLLEAALEAMHRDGQRREALQSRRDGVRREFENMRQQARSARDEAHRLAVRREALQTQLVSLSGAIARIEEQFARYEERTSTLEEQIAATSEPIASGREQLEEQLQSHLEVEEELTAVRTHVQEIEHELRELERSRHSIERETDGVRAELEHERLAAQTVGVRLATIVEQLNKGHAELPALLEGLAEDASEDAWQAQLERLGNQIARLGPINLAAIDEHRTQAERKTYLDAQNVDLVEALETLENAIRRIDRETRTRFKETFDRVNSGLQELFPRVFGGGHAYLEMTGEDLLDTGVTIMARPPGKRNATIHLLSGGEKALTAISLVFSIFRLNPSPFCMLDEVDAPLDDANVGRFARLVREMSETVQFIVITHNKITMEIAQQLMGVTMQEPGVSRLVSVDVDQAVAMAGTG